MPLDVTPAADAAEEPSSSSRPSLNECTLKIHPSYVHCIEEPNTLAAAIDDALEERSGVLLHWTTTKCSIGNGHVSSPFSEPSVTIRTSLL